MKIPQMETAKKDTGGIIYPKVTTWDVVKEYLGAAKFHWILGILMLIGWIVSTLFQSIIIPVFYKQFFDVISDTSPLTQNVTPLLLHIIFSILSLNIVVWAAYRVGGYGANLFFTKVMRRLGRSAFSGLLDHSHSFFSNNFSGSLTQRVNRYVKTFARLADNFFGDVVPLVVKIVGAIVVLYIVEPRIALVVFFWILLYLFASYCFAKYKLKYDVQVSAWETKYTGAIADAVANHDSVQLFTGEKNEVSRFDKVSNGLMDFMLFRWNVGSTIDAIQSLLTLGIEFFIFYYGIKYWQLGLISVGTFALIQAYVISIGGSLWGFSRVIRNIYESIADAKEMVEILHLKQDIADLPNARKLTVDKGQIEYKGVSFAFGKNKPVFEGMNISINPGEKVALIGSSGAGKSTLVKLLLRLYDIQHGEIIVDGQNIKEVTQDSLRENISLVPQDPALFHRSLMENIRYGKREATDEQVLEAARLAHCDIFINEFPQKYETFVGERGVKLSGGERQRVAIARAILKNAPILVLDEATSSLDSHSESLIQDALHTLMRGKTTIVIAHRLSTIRNMDRIIVVSKGGVVEEGSHDELLKKTDGVYANLWSLQAGGFAHKSIEELLEV